MRKKQLFYVGSFADSFYVIELDRSREEISLVNIISSPHHPAYMSLSPGRDRLYVANEHCGGTGGVSAYRLERPDAPEKISFWPSDTEGPAHIALSRDGLYLLGAGYFDGRVQAWQIDADGGIRRSCCTVQHKGDGPFRYEAYISVQDHARAHCAVPIPDTDLFACADLGTDEVYIYRLWKGQIEPVSRRKMRLGTGPRHIEIYGNGDILYLIEELGSMVDVLQLDKDTGALEVLQRISTLPDSFTGVSWASAIHLSPDKQHLYAANRGHESLAIYKVADEGRRLEHTGWFHQEISHCRDFCFDAGGDYVLTGGLDSDAIALNRVNSQTGTLHFISELTGISKPACILPVDE